jgi:hypothetical protein
VAVCSSAVARITALGSTIVLIGLSACGNPAGSDSEAAASATFSVDAPGFRYDSSTRAVDATLPLTIRNTGRSSLYYEPCGTILERAVENEWVGVWAMICSLEDRRPIEILPGSRASVDVRIVNRLGDGVAEYWTAPVNGEYRIEVLLYDEQGALPEETRISRPFSVRVR